MKSYLIDTVEITNITVNEQYGGVTKGTPFIKPARVEDTSKIFNYGTGKELKSEALIMLESDVVISTGDTLKITKRFGVAISAPKAIEVIKVFSVGGFMGSHLEVYA